MKWWAHDGKVSGPVDSIYRLWWMFFRSDATANDVEPYPIRHQNALPKKIYLYHKQNIWGNI